MRIQAFLQESPMFAVTRAARRFESHAAEMLRGDHLGLMDGLVLAALFFEAPEPVKPSQLAAAFGATRANISHCVSSLEAKGLLHRRIDPNDARAFLLTLKPQGRRTAMRVIGAFDKLQRAFEHGTGKAALTQMLASLRKLESLAK